MTTEHPLYHWIAIKPDGEADFGLVPNCFTQTRDDAMWFVKAGHGTVAFVIDASGHVVRTIHPEDCK